MNAENFVNMLSREGGENVFNQYSEVCTKYDLPNADKIRKKNLISYLDAQRKRNVTDLWVGESAGHNGTRRSGVFLYSENDFNKLSKKIGSKEFTSPLKENLRPLEQ